MIGTIVGITLGHAINWEVLIVGISIVPAPEGVNIMSMESVKSSMHLFGPKHFIFPFLAHAIGSITGGFLIALIAPVHNFKLAAVIGLFFLSEGVFDVYKIPAPTWFDVTDLVLAYVPMAFLGGKLALFLLNGSTHETRLI